MKSNSIGGVQPHNRGHNPSKKAGSTAQKIEGAAPPRSSCGAALIAAGIVALAALVVYLPALSYKFVGWDDTNYVIDNPQITAPDGLSRIWTRPSESPQYYPLTFTSYWLEYQSWKAEPGGYHVVNVVLHALSAALVVLLLHAYGLELALAVAAGLLFATTPINVISVAWIAERKNTLATFFALLSLLAYARYFTRGGIAGIVAGVAAITAVLAKTALLPLPIVAALAGIWIQRAPARRIVPACLFPLLLAVVPAYQTIGVEQQYNDLPLPDLSQRFLIAAAGLLHYLNAALWPVNLYTFYPTWNIAAVGAVALGVLVVLTGLFAITWKRLPPVTRWGLASFVLLLAPSLGLIPFGNMCLTWISDHFAYTASIALYAAFVALLAGIFRRFTRRAGAATVVAAAAISGAFAYGARMQLPRWENETQFWAALIREQPDFFLGYLGRARIAQRAGEIDASIIDQKRAIELRPSFIPAQLDFTTFLLEHGRTADAESALRGALQQLEKLKVPTPADKKDIIQARLNLASLLLLRNEIGEAQSLIADIDPPPGDLSEMHMGIALTIAQRVAQNGRIEEAEAMAKEMMRRYPNRAAPHLIRAEILLRQPIPPDIAPLLEAALAAEPTSSRAALRVATYYFNDGKFADAERVALVGLAANANDPELGRWLAKFYREHNDAEKAEPLLRRILQSEPDDTESLFSLGETLHRLGRPLEALPFYERLVQRMPNDARYWNNYGSALLDAKQVKDAIPKFEQALKLDAADSKAWFNLAIAKNAATDRPGAIECLIKATELNPQYARAQDVLSRLLIAERRYGDAAARCNMAINSLGLMNALPLAARYVRILSACPDDSVRNAELGLRAALRILEGNEENPDLLDAAAIAQAANGHYDDALRLGTKAQLLYEQQNRGSDAAAAAERLTIYQNHQVYIGD